MSIFTKDCPVCAASHPVHVVRCGCGYCFDPNKLDGVTQELEVISQEEQLYRDYLSARAAQAENAMHAAKIAAARDRGNTVKAAEALLAEQNAMSARAELNAQDQRARAVKNRINVVRSGRRARRAKVTVSAPRPAPVSVREALAPKPTIVAPVPIPPHITPPIPKAVQTKPTAPIVQVAKQNPPPRIAAPPKPVPAPVAQKPKPVDAAPRNGHHLSPPVAAKPTTALPVKPAPMRTPAARPAAVHAPVVVDKPTPSFRASQATKADQIGSTPAKPSSQECPNCSAKVPLKAVRCGCGFELPNCASEIPSLAMSPEDRAAFLAALTPVRRDPNR